MTIDNPEPTVDPAERLRFRVRAALLLALLVGIGIGIYCLAVYPPTPDSYYPGCSFHALTGQHCPGCGTTRALHSALNGHIQQALAYNALAFLVLPLVGFSLVQSLGIWLRGKPMKQRNSHNRLMWVIGFCLLMFGILRNLPYEPFCRMAPHELTTPE